MVNGEGSPGLPRYAVTAMWTLLSAYFRKTLKIHNKITE